MQTIKAKHTNFSEYSPGESLPCFFFKGKLRSALFLGKSLTYVLLEYETASSHRLLICSVEDVVTCPGLLMHHAKYVPEYWCRERYFALLENAALNYAEWHNACSIEETYYKAREMWLTGTPIKIKKGKSLHGHTEFKQPCLPIFTAYEKMGSAEK